MQVTNKIHLGRMLYLTYEELKRSVSISLKLTVSVTSECCILPMRN